MSDVNDTAVIDLSDIDFTGIQTIFTPRDPGDYPAIVSAAEARVAQKSGNPMITVEFTFTGGEAKGKIWNNYVLIPNSLWRLKKDALEIGCDPELFSGRATKDDVITDLINRPCTLTLDVEEYTTNDGELNTRNVIKRVSAADALGTGPAKKGKSKGF